jgi:DNA processing protein
MKTAKRTSVTKHGLYARGKALRRTTLRRNWLPAAWIDGVLLTEAHLRSSSLVTARLTLDLGMEIWACPGPSEDPSMEGPNTLLREGIARICLSHPDLLMNLDPSQVT